MIFFYPKIWSYSLEWKWKMIFLKKIHENMIFSSNVMRRWSFQKQFPWNMILLVLSGKIFFFLKTWYFFFGLKMKDDLSQEMHGNMIFSLYAYKCYKNYITILPKKIGRRRTPTLKKKLSFKFCHQNSVIEAGCLNFANS